MFPALGWAQVSYTQICFQKHCFHVETAKTEPERIKGLQGRKSLGRDEGMLFIFETSERHGFWMKDTLLPLDIIWLDADKRIVEIIPRVPPCVADPCPVYAPKSTALYVLEINAGMAAALGIKAGQQAECEEVKISASRIYLTDRNK